MKSVKVVELPLKPGALSDDTDLAAELHAIDMDKVRSRGNRWETIKGWSAFSASGMSTGTARGLYSWASLDGTPAVIAASESAVNAWISGTRSTITPYWVDIFLDKAQITFSANLITINWYPYTVSSGTSAVAAHNLKVGDTVTFSGVARSGGYDPNASFTVASVVTATQATLTASGSAPTIAGPAGISTRVSFRAGLATGTGDAIASKTRVYSMSSFGENAVFCGSDGTPIWYFQPSSSYAELVQNGGFASADNWVEGAAWSILSGKATAFGNGDLTQDMSSVLSAGKTYEMAFTTSTFANDTSLAIKIDSTPIHPTLTSTGSNGSSFNRTYTFRFVCPASPGNLTFTATTAAATTSIDNVSIKLLSIAHPIAEAPQVNRSLFVDGNHVLHALGSVEADGDFNALLYRWSDQDNFRTWVPDTTNIAGEETLSAGTTAVCGAPVGNINLILTDDAAFASTFTTSGYAVQLLGVGCGAVAPRALAVHNNIAFWAGLKGFHAFDGSRVLNVECPVKDRYVTKLRQYQENKTFAWINPEYGEVWFHYAHTDDGTEVSRYVIYNFLEQGNPWSFGTFNRTCWIRPGIYQYPIAIDSSGNIWNQETSTAMTGTGITLPFIQTGYVTGSGGDRWLGCRRYFPDLEAQTGNVLFTISGKRAPMGQNNSQDIGPFTITPVTRTVDFLLSSRQLKFKWASETSTTGWRLGIVGLEIQSDRERQ